MKAVLYILAVPVVVPLFFVYMVVTFPFVMLLDIAECVADAFGDHRSGRRLRAAGEFVWWFLRDEEPDEEDTATA